MTLQTTLAAAESFIAGFEGDELQEGIPEMLKDLRHAQKERYWDYSQLETAMCLYEEMASVRADKTRALLTHRVDRVWENNGSFGMKYIASSLAFAVENVWAALDGGEDLTDGISFDCEFIPQILDFVEWEKIDHNQSATLLPDTLAAMTKWRDETQARWAEAAFKQRYPDIEAYKAALEKAAGRRWGYPELINDCERFIPGSYEERVTPEAFVEDAGQEADLNDPDPITMQDLARIYR